MAVVAMVDKEKKEALKKAYKTRLGAQNFSQSFKTSEEYKDFFAYLKETDEWKECSLPNLRLEVKAEEYEDKGEEGATGIAIKDDEIVLKFPEKKAVPKKLVLKNEGVSLDLFETALWSIRMRARNIADIHDRFPLEVLCDQLNMSWPYLYKRNGEPEKGKILLRAGKVLGVMSERYAPLPQSMIFNMIEKYLRENYAGSEFLSGTYTHDLTVMKWRIGRENDSLLASYKDAWVKNGGRLSQIEGAYPVLIVSTNDIGTAAVTLRPMFVNGASMYALGEGVSTKHKGMEDYSKVEKLIPTAFINMQKAMKRMAELPGILIDNPKATLINAMSEVGLLKKAKKACADVVRGFIPHKNVTAYELYVTICDIFITGRGKQIDGQRKLNCEIAISRLLFVDWNALDIPGTELD